MAHRLPTPGSDNGTWGDILNDFLGVEHNPDGSQKPIDVSKITPGSNTQVLTSSGGSVAWTAPAAVAVTKVFDRTGDVVAQTGDYTAAQVGAATALNPTTVKSGAYSAVAGDFIPADATGADITITLPTAPTDKTRVGVKLIAVASSHVVTIAAGGSDVFNKISGSTSLTLSLLNQGVILQYASTGHIWYVQADDMPLTAADARFVKQSTLAAASGVATLDSGSKLLASQLPTTVLNNASTQVGGRRTVLLGAPGASSPAQADFTTFNTALSPRSLDIMLIFQSLETEPLFYSSYNTWAGGLGMTIMSTLSPGSHTLNSYTGGANDTTGLNSGGLQGLATTAKNLGKPIIVRLAHEFNGGWSNYGYTKETAAQFVAGWRHIVDVFRANGATNVLWFWCPNIWNVSGASSQSAVDPTLDDGSGSSWYPGDDYVDIIGLDGYMMTTNTIVNTPSDLFLANYKTITAYAPSKPFGIGEYGVAAQSRLSSIGGKAGWYNLFFKMVQNEMPKCIFVNQWQRITGPDDCTISSSGADTAAATAFVQGVSSSPFVASPTAVPTAYANTWIGSQNFQGGIKLPGGSAGYIPVSDSSGNLTLTSNPAAGIGTGVPSLMPGLMPTGAIAENFPRIFASGSDAGTPASGTPMIVPGFFLSAGQVVGHLNMYQSGTAPVGQTHAWVALLSTAGTILAISADAGTTAWSTGTFVALSIALSYTASSSVQTLVAIGFAGTTWPTLRGIANNDTLVDAWSSHIQGPSTTTGLTTPPSIGTSLGLPTATSNNVPYIFAS